MNKKLSNKITKEIVYSKYKCPNCERIVPNFSFLTKTKCIWCDAEYWNKKQVKA